MGTNKYRGSRLCVEHDLVLVQKWLTLYSTRIRFFRIKLETDSPKNLKKALLNSGLSRSVAEKIVAHYTKKSESA
jgi:hypothetical protein